MNASSLELLEIPDCLLDITPWMSKSILNLTWPKLNSWFLSHKSSPSPTPQNFCVFVCGTIGYKLSTKYFSSISVTHEHPPHMHTSSSSCPLVSPNYQETYPESAYFSLLPRHHLVWVTVISQGILQLTLNNLTFTLLTVNSSHSQRSNLIKIVKQILSSFCLKFSKRLITSTETSKSLLWLTRHLEIWTLISWYPFLLFPLPQPHWPFSSSSKAKTSLGPFATLFTVICSSPKTSF